jgi:nucleotide-binding universal stress UspA family protein
VSYSTLMVHLELEHSNDARLQIAGDLADQFEAKLIGIAACDPQPPYYAQGAFAHRLVEHERAEIKKRIAEAQERFYAAAKPRAREIEWRSAMERPTDYVAREARAADLLITGVNRGGAILDPLQRLDPGDLVMKAGRPVFVVPPEAEYLRLKNVTVAWKDTREARRAVYDALPLLQRAKQVNVLEVLEGDGIRNAAQHRVDDVVAWLGRHKITASAQVMHAVKDADQVEKILQNDADLVVAGAYWHSRVREWILGGITRNLLTRSRRCSFLAH